MLAFVPSAPWKSVNRTRPSCSDSLVFQLQIVWVCTCEYFFLFTICSSFLPPCEFQDLNSSHLGAWQQNAVTSWAVPLALAPHPQWFSSGYYRSVISVRTQTVRMWIEICLCCDLCPGERGLLHYTGHIISRPQDYFWYNCDLIRIWGRESVPVFTRWIEAQMQGDRRLPFTRVHPCLLYLLDFW